MLAVLALGHLADLDIRRDRDAIPTDAGIRMIRASARRRAASAPPIVCGMCEQPTGYRTCPECVQRLIRYREWQAFNGAPSPERDDS